MFPGCFYGWGFFFVYINMSTNLQPIPFGLIAIQPYISFVTVDGSFSETEAGEHAFQNDAFINPPSVFVDGLLLTYQVVNNRRYLTFDAETNTITIKNAKIDNGEIVEIFL